MKKIAVRSDLCSIAIPGPFYRMVQFALTVGRGLGEKLYND